MTSACTPSPLARPRSLRASRWGALALVGLLGFGAAPLRSADAVQFSPCRLEHESGMAAYAAECATFAVAEDPLRPNARQIELAVTRIPAVSRRKSRDPLFLIAGGPGMSSRQMYTAVASAFGRAGRDRDIVLLDQRGTGESAPLRCGESADATSRLDEAELTLESLLQLTRDCRQQLESRHNLETYTTSIAVGDLDAVRRVLGYPLINLYGISYGTRVVQHYMRRHPQHLRSVILDGVLPPGLPLGPDIPLDAQAALEKIFARCRAEAACFAAFGDSRRHLQILQREFAQRARRITLPDPRTAESRELDFGARHLAVVLRLSSYSSAQAALLPLVLHEAAVRENARPLASLYLQIVAGLAGSMAEGMHNTVVCTEDLPFVDTASLDRPAIAKTYLGEEMLQFLQGLCSVWPAGRIDADFHDALQSDVPVLLLSGSLDPVTPAANAERARKEFSRSRHLQLEGEGHGQLGVYCMDKLLADFLRDADPARLDAGCLAPHRPPAFHLSLAGPGP
jgi:pimeloyl-ACP methyl ester carboxylesterase